MPFSVRLPVPVPGLGLRLDRGVCSGGEDEGEHVEIGMLAKAEMRC